MRVAALDLFLDRGIASVTVEEICQRADVAPSTFFRHFTTKEDVVLVDLADRLDELVEAVVAQPSDASLGDVLAGSIRTWGDTRRAPTLLARELTVLAATPMLLDRLGHWLARWEAPITAELARRVQRDENDLEIRLLAAWFVVTIRIVLWEWVLSGASTDPFEFGGQAISHLVATPAAALRPA